MTIERVFNENSKIDIIDLINSFICENLDIYIEKYYNFDVENLATSNDKEEDVA